MAHSNTLYGYLIFTVLIVSCLLTYYHVNTQLPLYDQHYLQSQCLHTAMNSQVQYNMPVSGSASVSSKIRQFAHSLTSTTHTDTSSSSHIADLSAQACGADGQCGGNGVCFMFKCFCSDGYTGAHCDTADSNAVDMAGMHTMSPDVYTSGLPDHINKLAAVHSGRHLEQTSLAFAWYSHIGVQLGDTLELTTGNGCNTIAKQLVTVQPRYMSSYTLVDPLLTKVASKRDKCNSASPDDFLQAIPARNANTTVEIQMSNLEHLTAHQLYDTVILNDALLYTHDALAVLTNAYNALKDNGLIILTENVQQHINADVLAHYQQFFQLKYVNDESMKQRFDIPADETSEGQKYFIGRKRAQHDISVDSTTHAVVIAPHTEKPFVFKPEFYLIWTAADLQRWRYHVIDSIFHHHKNAIVHIYTHGLKAEQFSAFTDASYNVQLHYIDFHEFFLDTPLEDWSKLNFEHYNFRVHVSDAFRLAVVWKYGGVYIDFDFFVLHDLSNLRNMIAHEAYPGMVNGAFLTADQSHAWPQMSMIKFHTVHNISIWASSGPMLQSKMIHTYYLIDSNFVERRPRVSASDKFDERNQLGLVNVYLPKYFYPHPWEDAPNPKFWRGDSIDKEELEWTLTQTYGFHVWTAMVGGKMNNDDTVNEKYYMDPDSFMGQLVLRNCVVLCDDFLARNPRGYEYNKADKVYVKKHTRELPAYHLQPDTAE